MTELRKAWVAGQNTIDASHLVFLDESSVNTDMVRRYGRALSSNRTVDHAPLRTPTATTILASVRQNGETTHICYSGGTTGDRFVSYLKQTLLPTLQKDDIVVMDNLRSHHVQTVKQVFQEAGISYLYLPPYSPDLNPIEMMWSKIKSALRKFRAFSSDLLLSHIEDAFRSVSPSDSLGWFRADHYCSN